MTAPAIHRDTPAGWTGHEDDYDWWFDEPWARYAFAVEAAVAELARVTRPGGRVLVGALNPRSPWGLANHRRRRSGAWCHARFLNRAELRSLAAPALGAFQVVAIDKPQADG